MRLLVIALSSVALGACTSGIVQPYPPDWPTRPTMSVDCSEVSGLYAEAAPFAPGVPPPGAWAFLFPFPELRLNDRTVRERSLSIHFASNNSLHVDYLLDGKLATSRLFTAEQYKCKNDGLIITVETRTGSQIADMLPNEGTITLEADLFRVQNYLYVKNTWHSKVTFYYVIPWTSHTESWARFQSR